MTLEIVKNNKGGSKLCFECYTYTKKSASKTTVHWECSQRKEYVCKGKVTTYSQIARVIRIVEHSHDANLERVEATKIIASMKESAGTRRAKPAQLYTDHTQYATAHIRVEIGHQDLTQSKWRKVHSHSFDSEEVKLFFGMLDGLAFLLVSDAPAGLAELKEDISQSLEPLVDCFDATYIF